MIEIPPDLIVQGVAAAVSQMLERPEVQQRIVDRVAELRSEMMTPEETAQMLGFTTKTLRENHKRLGLTKSVWLGEKHPRYFRSEVLERAREKAVKGQQTAQGSKVVAMPPAQTGANFQQSKTATNQ